MSSWFLSDRWAPALICLQVQSSSPHSRGPLFTKHLDPGSYFITFQAAYDLQTPLERSFLVFLFVVFNLFKSALQNICCVPRSSLFGTYAGHCNLEDKRHGQEHLALGASSYPANSLLEEVTQQLRSKR